MSSRMWIAAASLVLGAAVGMGGYTFVYADGGSYLSNAPAACANCHVMDEHHAAWMKGSHREVATCNDCHTPQGTVSRYLAKARSGLAHSVAFTAGGYPDRLTITNWGGQVAEQACRTCHAPMTAAIDAAHGGGEGEDGLSCVHCHADVGHQVR